MLDAPAFRPLAAAALAAGLLIPADALAQPRPGEGDEGRVEVRDRRVGRNVIVVSEEPGGKPKIHRFELLGRGYLGIELTQLTPELRAHFGAPEESGILVARVVPDSPAAEAGVQVGDVIASIDGENVDNAFDLSRRVRGKDAGDSLTLEVYRGGRAQTLTATVREREREAVDAGDWFEWRQGEPGHGPMLRFRSRDCPEGCAGLMDPQAWEKVGESLGAIDWSELPRRVGRSNAALEQRIEELEKRLAELRTELEKLSGDRR